MVLSDRVYSERLFLYTTLAWKLRNKPQCRSNSYCSVSLLVVYIDCRHRVPTRSSKNVLTDSGDSRDIIEFRIKSVDSQLFRLYWPVAEQDLLRFLTRLEQSKLKSWSFSITLKLFVIAARTCKPLVRKKGLCILWIVYSLQKNFCFMKRPAKN